MALEQYRPSGFRLLPEVVKNILIINIIFFVASVVMERQGVDLNDILGLHYFGSNKFRIWQLITYMFMHGSVTHILFNMFAVWMFGSAIENIWGPKKFLIFYIVSGLGAAFAHYAVVYLEMQPAIGFINDYIANPSYEKLQGLVNSSTFTSFSSQEMVNHYNDFTAKFNLLMNTNQTEALSMSVDFMKEFRADVLNAPVVVGASGAVFGLLLAYGMMFPNTLLYIYLLIPIKAKYFVIIYGLLELFSGIAKMQGDNVAHFAHLGGLLSGFLLIMYWRYRRKHNHYN